MNVAHGDNKESNDKSDKTVEVCLGTGDIQSASREQVSGQNMIDMVNSTPGLSIDDLVARIDAKIAELEEEERQEKMCQEDRKTEDDAEKEDKNDLDESTSDSESGAVEPLPL